jgi:hypothetical protein
MHRQYVIVELHIIDNNYFEINVRTVILQDILSGVNADQLSVFFTIVLRYLYNF